MKLQYAVVENLSADGVSAYNIFDCPVTLTGDLSELPAVAERCAVDFRDNHGGTMARWPVTVVIYPAGQDIELARFCIEKTRLPIRRSQETASGSY